MINLYQNISIILELEAFTPVIRALFAGFHFDLEEVVDGHVYCGKAQSDPDPTWSDIRRHMGALRLHFGLESPTVDVESNREHLLALAIHFGTHKDPDLLQILENWDFSGPIYPSALHFFATRFDDGHGLKAMKFQVLPKRHGGRHLEYENYREYHGRNIWITDRSNTPVVLGPVVDAALDEGDFDKAAHRLFAQIDRQLNGVFDPSIRSTLRTKLVDQLIGQIKHPSNNPKPNDRAS